jgi:hypothetical protein
LFTTTSIPKHYLNHNLWLRHVDHQYILTLDLKYYGPFPVVARIGKQAYKLRLGDKVGRIHPVFHVSLLEPCPPGMQPAGEDAGPPLEVEDEEQEWVVEKILDSNVRSRELQYLVKWKDFPDEENTWEPLEHLGNRQSS